jgi:hypothetical protein
MNDRQLDGSFCSICSAVSGGEDETHKAEAYLRELAAVSATSAAALLSMAAAICHARNMKSVLTYT